MSQIQSIAERLREAQASRKPVAPVREEARQGDATLAYAIAQVNEVQLDAGHAVDKFVSGESENVHQMMMALQKADVSFQLMMQIRNKLVSAYEDIQRMQI